MTNRIDYILAFQADTGTLKAIPADLDQIGRHSQQAAQEAVTAFGHIKEIIAGMGLERLGEMAIQSGAAQVAAAFAAGEGLEGLRNRYDHLLGSQQAANAELDRLQKLANGSDFTMQGLAQDEAALMGTGKSAAAARAELLAIAQTGAGLALTSEQVQGVTEALVQMANKGHVSTEELNQLSDRGVNGLSILAQYLGKSNSEALALVETGHVASSVFEQAFEANAQQHFAAALEQSATSMRGLLSTAQDLRDQLGGDAMAAAFSELEPVLSRVLTELQDPKTVENVKEIGKALGDAAASALTFAENAGKALGIINTPDPADSALSTAQARLDALLTQQQGAAAAAAQATNQQISAQKELENQIRAVGRQEEDVRKSYRDLIDPLQEAVRLENERYQTAVSARNLQRAETTLHKDQDLMGNIFSNAGAAARDRIESGQDQQRVSDLEFEQSHQQRVNGLQDQIALHKRQEQAALDALDKEKRALDLQKEGLQTTNGLIGAQATGIAGLTKHIMDQVKFVQDLATAWGAVATAQGAANMKSAAATDASNLAQLGTPGPAPLLGVGPALGNAVSAMSQSFIAGMLHPGSPGWLAASQKAQTAQAALGTSITAAVAGNTPESTAVVTAYQKWQAGEALTPAEQAALDRARPLAYTQAIRAGTSNAPFATAGATVGTYANASGAPSSRPNVNITINTGPASQTDWDAVGDKIDKSLARHWGGP